MIATILVVDDEPDLETLVKQRFRRQIRGGEYGFCFAHDGVEALEMLAAGGAVDMVLSDINMPRMDGLSLLEKIQQSDDPLSTVIVSAYGDMTNIRLAMNRGAFDFLMKPIDFGDLETTIKKPLAHIDRMRKAKRRQAEAERAHASLSRYFSPNLAQQLVSDPDTVDLGGQRREITALFTDIAEFTTTVETLDLDIIAIGDIVRRGPDPILPHPRAHERAFVLTPLAEVAPEWVHPALGRSVGELLGAVGGQDLQVIDR